MNPFAIGCIVLGVLLMVSTGLNAWQYHEHDKILTVAASIQQLATDVTASAKACSDGVDTLAKRGEASRVAIVAAVDGAKGRITGLQHDAIEAIKARPADPNDLCGSLDKKLRELIRAERGAK